MVVIINIILFAGIMGRAVPAVALNSAMPEASDRGAYMSINSSLQQLSGGIGAFIAGHIVVQKAKHMPIEHFNTLGYIMILIIAACAFFVYRVHKIVRAKQLVESA
jgi:predicted MFS family arabinose efflux permease